MRRLWSVLSVFIVALPMTGIARPVHLAAQAAGPTPPHSPDLLGIYTGMPADQAKTQLQTHSSDVYVQYATNAAEGFGMSVPGMPTDEISVDITQPPNVPAVWRIQRYQGFSNDRPLPQGALVEALRQKYGNPTFSRTPDAGHIQLYWIYDANGQPRTKADPALMECNSVVPSVTPKEIAARCAQEFFALYVDIMGESVKSYTMVLINLPYASGAAKRSADAKRAAQDQAPKSPTEKVPSF